MSGLNADCKKFYLIRCFRAMAQHPLLLFGNTHLGAAKGTWFNIVVVRQILVLSDKLEGFAVDPYFW